MINEKKLKFLNLHKNLISYILFFNSKAEQRKLLNCKNKRLFTLTLNSKNNNFENIFKSDPSKLKYRYDFTEFSGYGLMNSFEIFTNNKNELILAFMDDKYLKLMNILTKKITFNLNLGLRSITCLKYFYDRKYNEYLIYITCNFLSIIKLEDFKNIDISLRDNSNVYSVAVIFQEDIANIIVPFHDSKNIEIYNVKGVLLRKISTCIKSNFIDIFHKEINQKGIFIISANNENVTLHDFFLGRLSYKYEDKVNKGNYYSAFIYNGNNKFYLVAPNQNGIINLWDVFSCELLQIINIKKEIRGILKWNTNYAIIAGKGELLIIDLMKFFICKTILGVKLDKFLFTMVKFVHPHLGECLFAGSGLEDHKIYFWRSFE